MTGGVIENDVRRGLRGDSATAVLRANVMQWQDIKQGRLAATQRHLDPVAEELGKLENRLAEWVRRELRKHPVWAWLKNYPGLGGCHTAFLIAAIGDPRRFPGQACSVGHIHPPLYEVGEPCPMAVQTRENDHVVGLTERADSMSESDVGNGDTCPGKMLPPRETTGVRSLWHYCGLHVVNGRSPRKTKGQQSDWNPRVRASLLQPDGIADQIVRQRVPRYRDIYEDRKEKIARERGVDNPNESDAWAGSGADQGTASEKPLGLRPFQVDDLARKIAVKAFVGDLLIAWKSLMNEEKPRHKGAGREEER